MGNTNIKVEDILARYDAEYERLYNIDGPIEGFEETVNEFDRYAEENPEIIRDFCNRLGDLITSDREVVAFMHIVHELESAAAAEQAPAAVEAAAAEQPRRIDLRKEPAPEQLIEDIIRTYNEAILAYGLHNGARPVTTAMMERYTIPGAVNEIGSDIRATARTMTGVDFIVTMQTGLEIMKRMLVDELNGKDGDMIVAEIPGKTPNQKVLMMAELQRDGDGPAWRAVGSTTKSSNSKGGAGK